VFEVKLNVMADAVSVMIVAMVREVCVKAGTTMAGELLVVLAAMLGDAAIVTAAVRDARFAICAAAGLVRPVAAATVQEV
jgi:hypothetical protein